jgi:hypothetical protein
LKEFSIDRKKYYNKYYLGKNVEDKDSQAAIMGRLAETLLMEEDEFDKKFGGPKTNSRTKRAA